MRKRQRLLGAVLGAWMLVSMLGRICRNSTSLSGSSLSMPRIVTNCSNLSVGGSSLSIPRVVTNCFNLSFGGWLISYTSGEHGGKICTDEILILGGFGRYKVRG